MSKEWFPWYPARFRADTMHLTAEQDGIYRRLIDHYMETGLPLPDNDAALARVSGISIDTWGLAAAIVRPFFRQQDGKLWLKKCDEILADQACRSEKNSRKGRAGAEKRWKAGTELPKENGSSHADTVAELKPQDATGQDKTRQDKDQEDRAVVKSRATAVIALFDSCVEEVFGKEKARQCPAATDSVFAERFLALGASEEWLKMVFFERLTKRKASGQGPITDLCYLKDAIPEAYQRFISAKTAPINGGNGSKPHVVEQVLKTTSVAEKQRANETLQRFQSGARA